MGTSSSFKGQSGHSPLIPSWLNPDQETSDQPPQEMPPDGEGPFERPEEEPQNDKPPAQPSQSEPDFKRFQSSRSQFSSYIKSGGTNSQKLGRALSNYVKKGTGGSANATKRMVKSVKGTAKLAGIFGGFVRDGIDTTLNRLNLSNLIGKPFIEILTGLFDYICPLNGNIPDSIVSEAYGETIRRACEMNLETTQINAQDLQTLIGIFISEAIKTRLYNDIGRGAFKFASDDQLQNNFSEVTGFADNLVSEIVSKELDLGKEMSEPEITSIINDVYQVSYELMERNGEE